MSKKFHRTTGHVIKTEIYVTKSFGLSKRVLTATSVANFVLFRLTLCHLDSSFRCTSRDLTRRSKRLSKTFTLKTEGVMINRFAPR